MQLVKWEAARQAIAKAHSVDELKQIRDKAEAYRYALKLAGEAPEAVRQMEEIKVRAERRAGEFLLDMPKAKGVKGRFTGGRKVGPPKEEPTYSDLDIDKRDASRWQRMAEPTVHDF